MSSTTDSAAVKVIFPATGLKLITLAPEILRDDSLVNLLESKIRS